MTPPVIALLPLSSFKTEAMATSDRCIQGTVEKAQLTGTKKGSGENRNGKGIVMRLRIHTTARPTISPSLTWMIQPFVTLVSIEHIEVIIKMMVNPDMILQQQSPQPV